tara:strand:+ start:788 stop:2575 length:1788 start_codon:yes stop_codon:yes gene_type:complete
MRIPVYRSTAQRTNEAPGRSFSARMDARPFVEAALQKGASTRALADAVGAYAEQRGKMIAEAEYNETALALDEEIRTATYDLSRSNDIGNIFDGNKLWEKRMKSIQSNVLGRVKNSNVRRKLDFSFNQSEIQSRFTLQGVVDQKIVKREQAAIAARQTNAVAALTQNGSKVSDYLAFFGTGTTPGKNGVMTAPGVAGGRANAGAVSKANLAMRVDVASGYVANRYGAEPTSAMKLISFVNLLDEAEINDDVDLAEIAGKSGIVDPYAVTVLSQIPRAEALAIVTANLSVAIKIYDAQEKLAGDLITQNNKLNEEAYFLGFTGKTTLTYAELSRVIPVGYLDDRLDKFADVVPNVEKADRLIAASAAKRLIYDFLDEQNYLSPEKRDRLNSQIGTSGEASFPDTSNQGEKVRLNALANRGLLTIDELHDARLTNSLSGADYISLENKIYTKNNENLNEFLRFAKAEYSYTEEVAEADDEISVAITAAYDAVAKGLIEFTMDNPDATSTQIKTEGRALIAEQAEAHRAVKREGYLKYLDKTGDGAIPIAFPIDPANPVQSINNFLSSGVVLREEQRQILLGRIRVLNSPRFKEQWQQ